MNYQNYISCDNKTLSEIVIPVMKNNQLIGVLDVDGDQFDQYDHIDQKYLEKIANLI
jgi:GAF domain-containing protein